MNNLSVIQQWLLQKHIQVSKDWIEACLEWLSDQIRNPSINDLKDAVYKQWISEDLREMGCRSLPCKITSIHRIVLRGRYILQINSLRDISQPAFGQLEKNKNAYTTGQGNHLVSAAPMEPEPPWKTKPKRMLYLDVTDGSQELYAMEYKAISELDLNTTPGTKVLIIGPVECRMGVLLLQSKNVQVLGGHVESLLATNTQEEVLKRALGDKSRVSENDSVSRSTNCNPQANVAATINRNSGQQTLQGGRAIASELRGNARSTNSNRSVQNKSESSSNRTTGQKRSFSVEDEFEIEDDDAFFEDMDVNLLIKASQDAEAAMFAEPQPPAPHRHQEQSRVDSVEDDFNFMDAERMFEEEMENMETSFDHVQSGQKSDLTQIDWKCPYSYLSSVDIKSLSQDPTTAEHVIIKGFISTVTSQLKPHPTRGWLLSAKVNDGTMSIEVDLADTLLTELIGLTVKDVMRMKGQAKMNSKLNERVLKSVSQCETSLRNMSGLMELVLVSPRPCLLRNIPFETRNLKTLADRVVSSGRALS